jgi:DNA-binding PadR family transcriptional regulator
MSRKGENGGRKGPDRRLSTLEFTILGLAWLRGPCTIYALMKELSLSASSYHKSRAGTAYSVANRLIDFEFLKFAGSLGGEEKDRLVLVTEAGVEVLKEWLAPPIPMADIAHSADLLRLRFFFLESLELEDRLAFIDQALIGLEDFLKKCEALISANQEIGDYYGALATASSILETKARIRWLGVVRQLVTAPLASDSDWSAQILSILDKE